MDAAAPSQSIPEHADRELQLKRCTSLIGKRSDIPMFPSRVVRARVLRPRQITDLSRGQRRAGWRIEGRLALYQVSFQCPFAAPDFLDWPRLVFALPLPFFKPGGSDSSLRRSQSPSRLALAYHWLPWIRR